MRFSFELLQSLSVYLNWYALCAFIGFVLKLITFIINHLATFLT